MSKNVYVSNSGSYSPSEISYDDSSALSSSVKLTANTASFVGQSGILQIKNKQLVPVASGVMADSGSVLTYIDGISNGVLNSSLGGFGTSSYIQNSIITTSGSGPIYGTVDKVVAVIDSAGTWGLADSNISNFTPSNDAVVYLYTGSSDVSGAIYNWTKPPGTRFIRIICQGGGGGGGGGSNNSSAGWQCIAGSGGGAGGYGDVTIDADIILENQNIVITVGSGGAKGTTPGVYPGNGSNPGQSSSFGPYIYSGGGAAGGTYYIGNTSAPAVGVGGVGYLINGSNGGYGANGGGASGYGVIGVSTAQYYGALGGGSGGGMNTAGKAGGGNALVAGGSGGVITTTNNTICPPGGNSNVAKYFDFKSYYLNGTGSSNLTVGGFPALVASGAGGGGGRNQTSSPVSVELRNGDGGNGKFGAGGGGGAAGQSSTNYPGIGGAGGAGYVLIICY